MTTPPLHLERTVEGPVFVHGWLIGDGVRSAVGLPPDAFAALELALDAAGELFRQRDEAITERDAALRREALCEKHSLRDQADIAAIAGERGRARQLLLDAGISVKPGTNLVKTVLADLAWLAESHARVCARRRDGFSRQVDAAQSRSAAEQDVIVAAREWREARPGPWVSGSDVEFHLLAAVDALDQVTPSTGDEGGTQPC